MLDKIRKPENNEEALGVKKILRTRRTAGGCFQSNREPPDRADIPVRSQEKERAGISRNAGESAESRVAKRGEVGSASLGRAFLRAVRGRETSMPGYVIPGTQERRHRERSRARARQWDREREQAGVVGSRERAREVGESHPRVFGERRGSSRADDGKKGAKTDNKEPGKWETPERSGVLGKMVPLGERRVSPAISSKNS